MRSKTNTIRFYLRDQKIKEMTSLPTYEVFSKCSSVLTLGTTTGLVARSMAEATKIISPRDETATLVLGGIALASATAWAITSYIKNKKQKKIEDLNHLIKYADDSHISVDKLEHARELVKNGEQCSWKIQQVIMPQEYIDAEKARVAELRKNRKPDITCADDPLEEEFIL